MNPPRPRRHFHLDRFGRQLKESVDDELQFHLETRIEELVRLGRSREEARTEVLERFGDPESVARRCRQIDQRGVCRRALTEMFSDLLKDVRFASRALRKARGYTAVTVLSLAVGIGVNSALFTAIHAVWMAPVPGVNGQDRMVDPVSVDAGGDRWGWTYPDFAAVLEAETPLESLSAWIEDDATVGAQEGGERVHVAYASAGYFHVMGALPTRGRGFLPSEDSGPGQHPVAVVSHDFWRTRLGGRTNVMGQAIILNRAPYTVIGVAPEGFQGARVTLSTVDLWVPLVQYPGMSGETSFVRDRDRYSVQVLGRLRPGTTRSEAEAALQTVFNRLAAEYPETNRNRTVRVAAFGRFPAQNRIWDMMAVAGMVGLLAVLLLIICGNLAGMALARSAAREQEIGVRLALGSSRLRLARLLLAEALLLALAGGISGAILAMFGMATLSPPDLGISAPGVTFQPSAWVLVMSGVMAFAAALVVGFLPALRFSRPEVVLALKDDSGGGGRRVGRIQRVAASAQVGAAFSLLVVGALFLRSLGRPDENSLGFKADGLVVTDFGVGGFFSSALLDLSDEGYPTLEEGGAALLDRLGEAVGSLPGVTAVAMGDGIPLDRRGSFGRVAPAGLPDEPEGQVTVEVTRVTEGYFAAIGAPILQGRGIQASDDASSEPVAVITRSLAERLWPREDALGKRFLWPAGSDTATATTVIGVVGRVASSRPSYDLPQVFLPVRQDFSPNLLMVFRTPTDAAAIAGPFHEALRSVDPGLPLPRLLPGKSVVSRATRDQRASGRLGGGVGILVLILSAIGVYGVVSLAVTHRTREIGLRIAMGATRGQILRKVLGDAFRLTAPGMIVGALLAAGTGVAMRSMLLGLSPIDPASFLLTWVLLLLVVFLASLFPALKASGIQPVKALRSH